MHHKISALTLTLLVTGSSLTVAEPLLNDKLLPKTEREYAKSLANSFIDAHYDLREANRAFNPNKGASLTTKFENSSKLAFNYKPEEEKLTLDVSRIKRDYAATGTLFVTNVGAGTALLLSALLLMGGHNSCQNVAHLLPYGTAIGYSEAYKTFEQNNTETNSYYYYATNKTSFDFCKTSDGKWELVSAVDNQELKNSLEKIVNTYDLDHFISSEALDLLEKTVAQQN